jgi:hypothetical protein
LLTDCLVTGTSVDDLKRTLAIPRPDIHCVICQLNPGHRWEH